MAKEHKNANPKGIQRKDQLGSKSPNWKGGSYISSDGYRLVTIRDRINVKSPWSVYEREHRVVIEKHLGRKLLKKETIHHIDGDKLNNKIDNLFLCENHSKHRQAHTSLHEIGYFLIKIGAIEFKNGAYLKTKRFKEILEGYYYGV